MNHLSQAHLIAAMLENAEPVVKAFHGDLRHDAKLIANAQDGDVFLWAPYEHGSRIVVLWRGDRPNTRAASIFSAMQEAQKASSATAAPLAWFRITISPELCSMTPVTADEACGECWGALRTAETGRAAVSELHM